MASASGGAGSDKRVKRAPRINGPFQGRWLGALDIDVTVHDLSITGCLIQCFHEVPVGRRITLEIDLPSEGTVKLSAETVYTRPDYGFAVKFVEMSPQTKVHLARTVFHRLTKPRPKR